MPTAWQEWLAWGICLASGGYQLTVVLAAIWHRLRPRRRATQSPGISILKPVAGSEPDFYRALRSHATQDYPEFEILFGLSDPNDHALADIQHLQAEFPHLDIRIIHSITDAPNRKVGKLIDLAREARYPLLLVNDADIEVPAHYLRDVAAPLEDAHTGVVTCLFRCHSPTLAGEWEAFGVMAEFVPSTLAAPVIGINEFGLGATLCFRAADLARIGGFPALSHFIADDYQLAKHIVALGKRVELSQVVVTSGLQAPSLADAWAHQVRWARTVRVSRLDGYLGLPVTFTSLWALLTLAAGFPIPALLALAARYLMAIASAALVLRSTLVFRWLPLLPLRDLMGVAIWIAGLTSNTVTWRGRRLRLDRNGRIASIG
ncbi:MAG: bacteriohopanetetrol glucosamine biosynthesis glycosyltransferase HpnI [Bryobacterales bacterium]|nr:bacteriohopanetetrol glucosamine biosynthesis glycosyltransferase HpnI [Bryobacterales bacterium]